MASNNEKTIRRAAKPEETPVPAAPEDARTAGVEADHEPRPRGGEGQKANGNGDDAIENASLAGREIAGRSEV